MFALLVITAAISQPHSIELTVTSPLPSSNVPLDPVIDFAKTIREHKIPGVLDPNSIDVVNLTTGRVVPHARTDDFAYGDKGRIEWVIHDPQHKRYQIRFKTSKTRPALLPQSCVPMIGNGDLLRYNASEPRPIALVYHSGLVDLTGDGKPDLVGCWNYSYRPGDPWSGIVCYPRVGSLTDFQFGDLVRIRYVPDESSREFKHFDHQVYMWCDFVDLNRDGKVDIVYSPRTEGAVRFYLNSGMRDDGGMPIFVATGTMEIAGWPVRATDIDGDGDIDIVSGNGSRNSETGVVSNVTLYRNLADFGWPLKLDKATAVELGTSPCFVDVDGDGLRDVVCLQNDPNDPGLNGFHVGWKKNLDKESFRYGPTRLLPGVNSKVSQPRILAAVNDGPHRGILVGGNVYETVSLFVLHDTKQSDQPESEDSHGNKLPNHEVAEGREPSGSVAPDGLRRSAKTHHWQFRLFAEAVSSSAVISLSDQSAPFVCDWDNDGDRDLLVGGGYGWPRIVINQGTKSRPAYGRAQLIRAEGKPIRLLRNQILGPPSCWHDMGYPFPALVRWDEDDLPDLVVPNETNRIFWYRNIGTLSQPQFGKQRQVIVDGYPDSREKRTHTARLVADSPHVYPSDKTQPFYWRTGAAFGDFNGDGLADIVQRAWSKYSFTRFLRYRDPSGGLQIRVEQTLKAGGKQFHGARVNVVDWNGDGNQDIVYSAATNKRWCDTIFLVLNRGTNAEPRYDEAKPLRHFGKPIYITRHGPHPWAGDFDNDGKPDLVCYTEWSVYPFYTHAALTMQEKPTYILSHPATTNED